MRRRGSGSLIGNAGVILAVRAVLQRIVPAEVEVLLAGIADRPFAGVFGEHLKIDSRLAIGTTTSRRGR